MRFQTTLNSNIFFIFIKTISQMKILFPILLISVSLSAQEKEKKQVFSRMNTTKMQKLDLTDYKMLNSMTP
ncbi:hypothetical protein GCM10023210_11940 [Chryseobacterium ginsengisoli]|uniref:Uncharacterized protein n=1 Tax=Chryseobacterium ginsengisoli TaxID=363853 RepID=A0ABP9M3U9_9FLAO